MFFPPCIHRALRRGFTLIELLVVIAILVLLLGAIFVFLDPVRRFNMARNTTRRTDSQAIARAVQQTLMEDEQEIPPAISIVDRKWRMIGKAGRGCSVACGNLGVSTAGVHVASGSSMEAPDAAFPFDVNDPFSLSFSLKGLLEDPRFSAGHGILTKFAFSARYATTSFKGFYLMTYGKDMYVALCDAGLVCTYAVADDIVDETKFDRYFVTYSGNPDPRVAVPIHIYKNGFDVNARMMNMGGIPRTMRLPDMPLLSGVAHFELGHGVIQGAQSDYLDDLRIYRGIPGSHDDILAIGAGGEHRVQTSPNLSLHAHWTFDELIGDHFEDSSDNAFDMRLVGSLQERQADMSLRYELPDTCLSLSNELASLGALPKLPAGPATDDVEPSDEQTYYAIRSVNGAISVRSCLSEGEGKQGGGEPPVIEVSR